MKYISVFLAIFIFFILAYSIISNLFGYIGTRGDDVIFNVFIVICLQNSAILTLLIFMLKKR